MATFVRRFNLAKEEDRLQEVVTRDKVVFIRTPGFSAKYKYVEKEFINGEWKTVSVRYE
jgi:hypothetical protein